MESRTRFGLVVVVAALALAACGGRRSGGGGNPDTGPSGSDGATSDGALPDGTTPLPDGAMPGDDLGMDGGAPGEDLGIAGDDLGIPGEDLGTPIDLGSDLVSPPFDFGVDFGFDAGRPDLGFDMGRDLGPPDLGRDLGTDFGTPLCGYTRLTCSSGTVHATTSTSTVTTWADCSGGTGYDRDDAVWVFTNDSVASVTISSTGGGGVDYDLFAVSSTFCDGSGVCLGSSRGTTGSETVTFTVSPGEQVIVGYDRYATGAGAGTSVDLTISCL